MYEDIKKQLNAEKKEDRLAALKELSALVKSGKIPFPEQAKDVNNHVHTIYSFSPYSPSAAVWNGFMAGLKTIGIMDHDSVSGLEEFIEAAEIIGIAATCGVETRVKMNNTPLNGKKINNPDQISVAYVAMHGIPHTQINTIKEFFKPYNEARIARDRKMTENINSLVASVGVTLDFDKDVLPISMAKENGSVTERHLLYALANKLLECFGKGEALVSFLENDMKISLSSKIKEFLLNKENPYYDYDLLGALKSDMVEKFYIDANDECPDVAEFLALAKKVGAISAYAYLGDVKQSVTGDKKAQKFEDDYIDLLFDTLANLGFNAVTYMPSRNDIDQLRAVRSRCEKYGLFQISGEDINTPRQTFICFAQRDEEFSNLYDAAWALIGHEKAATENIEKAMFSEKTLAAMPKLEDRISYYKEIGIK
ncbi:MAG: PHP domain-containing protein [Clostridiales bacterium]|nr:MAG: PHP domain-containing protein [Clostridiales bacterium]